MSKDFTAKELEDFASNAISNLTKFLKGLIAEGSPQSLKRTCLFSYWITDYIAFQKQEDLFDPTALLRYDRGSILQIDFGYRVGKELGGRHFAVVIDNRNNLRSNTITVVPLKSLKRTFQENQYHFILKKGLYQLVEEKINRQLSIAQKANALHKEELKRLILSNSELDKLSSEEKILFDQKLSLLEHLTKQNDHLTETLEHEIVKVQKLKEGSILEVGQLTTVSKQRIVIPKKVDDILSGLKLDIIDLDEMNKRLVSLYIRNDKLCT